MLADLLIRTYDYNIFMDFGGIRCMGMDYTNAEWAGFVVAHGGVLDYKRAE